jgi:hypothetical protein
MLTSKGVRPGRAAGLAVMMAVAASAAADSLTITPDPNPAPAGVAVTFSIDAKVRSDADSVTFDFADGGSGKIEYTTGCAILGGCSTIAHSYAGPGLYTVTASGTISGQAVSGTAQITITSSTADTELYVPTGAHLTGFKNVNWRTDLEIHNPGTHRVSYIIALLLRDQDNNLPTFKGTFLLDARRSARYNDLLYATFGFSGAAAIRLTPIDGPIIVTSRTYNQVPTGTYGQSVPTIARSQAIAFSQDARMIALSHDPTLAAGYRTNLGFVNASPAQIRVEAEFYLATGVPLGERTYDLQAFGFRQIDRAFEQVTADPVDDGYIVVRTTTPGAKFFANAVVVDNLTGDPTYVDAVIPE